MKTLIRANVFETNSSSTHSVSVSDGSGLMDNIIPNENGEIVVIPREFGWGYEEYNDPETKLAYLLQYFTEKGSPLLEVTEDVVKEHTGASKVVLGESDSKWWPNGYIDHQSMDCLDGEIVTRNDIRNFVFDSHSVLVIDNDNH